MSTLYSLTKLELISGGDEEFITEIKKVFAEEVLSSLHKLKIATANKDYNSIKQIAHSIKPSIDSLSIESLYDEIRLLESLANKKEDMEAILLLAEKVDTILREVIEDMEKTTILKKQS